MLRPPLKHQAQGIAYAQDKRSLALFWQMRLGKSLVAIRWAKPIVGKKLIVSPLTTIISWENELKLEGCESASLVGSTNQKLKILEDNWDRVDWFVVNPEGLRAAKRIATHYPWEVVIADEATFMSNPQAQITKLIRRELRDVPYRCVLAGEPCAEGPQQVVELMFWLYGEFMRCRNFWEWRVKYMGRGPFGFVPTVRTIELTKTAVHGASSMLRARDVGLFMPKVFETRRCQLPSSVKKMYLELEREWALGGLSTKYVIVKDIWLAQIAAGVIPKNFDPEACYVSDHKSKELINLMKGELRNQRVVVWARYTREIVMHKRKLRAAGFNVASITGAVDKAARATKLEAFKVGKLDALICQQRCVQYGMDLSFCDVMIYTSNYWDWLIRAQCDERTSHPQKTTPSLIIDLVSDDTIEEDVVSTLHGKKISSRHFMEKLRGSHRIRRLVEGV